ncbi:thiamine pyrophosphokinase [Bacillus coahuilensis m2-6]|uniref:thiamine diphosphokinase n=2 Tax=Bacillus coahuilensis TaxID=408580 RepID=UPI00075063F0|nr:thiamine diphosphokinase [Bacillus coahuilensis]KUP08625.1 thiamine pyrophosphokinase [Bacillus coahuilensis m2-6]
MNIHIVGGGPESSHPEEMYFNDSERIWVGVDRGVHYLLDHNIVPHCAFGDFDSVSHKELSRIKSLVEQMHVFPPEKDETDMGMALNWAIEQKPTSISIYGGTGGRLDHYLANIQLLIRTVETTIPVFLIDHRNIHQCVKAGTHQVSMLENKPYISFFSMTESVKDLTLQGFKYPLENHFLRLGSSLCISNELIESHGSFSFTEGILMMIRSAD